MRKQIAAANWKMNCTYHEGELLLNEILENNIELQEHQRAVFAVPFPYLIMANGKVGSRKNYAAAAQNCSNQEKGAYTGEVSVDMLASIDINYVVIGHSERREYYHEDNKFLAEKVDRCLAKNITPIFCCGEPLNIREEGTQNSFVETQLRESLFHLSAEQVQKIVIAYEPIWAIGTGRTASSDQAQEMHAHLRAVLAAQYGQEVANNISILYGGSVKASNAEELFSRPDVDGGLVGGASLVSTEFAAIMRALK